MGFSGAVPIVIVGFRNASEISECLTALDTGLPEPAIQVLICENGGAAACDALIRALSDQVGPCTTGPDLEDVSAGGEKFERIACLALRRRGSLVAVAQAKENLGFAGAVNAWLSVLLSRTDWPGVWILNPDTQPSADALAELVAYARTSGTGMVTGRILLTESPDTVQTRGLRWKKLVASTEAVDRYVPAAVEPDAAELSARIDAPSGACIYVTRACLEKIGLMDERYFLYFEDLDWGLRAKQHCGLGYAWRAVIYHHGGTTIGTAPTRAQASPLAVYLEFRNRIIFVHTRFRMWLPWTIFVEVVRAAEYGVVGAVVNMRMAYRGLVDGLMGRTGRPDDVLAAHLARTSRDEAQ